VALSIHNPKIHVFFLIHDVQAKTVISFIFQHSYKMWTCSKHFTFYQGDIEIPPCFDVCSNVENRCPFFRPDSTTVHAGEPSFLCKGKSN